MKGLVFAACGRAVSGIGNTQEEKTTMTTAREIMTGAVECVGENETLTEAA